MRPLTEIIVHCTDTYPDWWASKPTKAKVAEVRRWHTTAPRNWSDIGYHFLIDRDGTVAEGRPLAKTGAHTKGHNTGTIGISLFGGHGSSASDGFYDNFTEEQDRALWTLIEKLRDEYPSITTISGHNQYAAKACPGFSVPQWLDRDGKTSSIPPVQSKDRAHVGKTSTAKATAVQVASAAGTGVAALGALDGRAQLVVIACLTVTVLAAMWIFKERLRKFRLGDR